MRHKLLLVSSLILAGVLSISIGSYRQGRASRSDFPVTKSVEQVVETSTLEHKTANHVGVLTDASSDLISSVLPETPKHSDWRNYNPSSLVVNLDGVQVRFDRVSFNIKNENTVWVGRRSGNSLSFYVASSSKNLYFATVEDGHGTSYSVEVNNKTNRVVTTYDERGTNCSIDKLPKVSASNVSTVSQVEQTVVSQTASATATTSIDLLLLVDEATFNVEKSDYEALYTKCLANVESSNQELVNSKITNFRWNVVGLSIVPTSLHVTNNDISVELADLYNAGPLHTFVASKKAECGADQVHFLVTTADGNWGGIAWQSTDLPYGVTRWDQITYRTMSHEMGHNLMASHDRITASTIGKDQSNYSYGYMQNDKAYFYYETNGDYTGDIMSYAPHRLPYFANPDIVYTYSSKGTYNGKAYDLSTTFNVGVAIGQPDEANASKTISENASILANSVAHVTTPRLLMDLSDVPFVDGNVRNLAVVASDTATYQWYKNGLAIAGATNSTLSVSIKANDSYYCVANIGGTVVKSHVVTGTPFVAPQINTSSKAVNISTRSTVRGGSENIVAGFVITGSSKKTVLIRAGGPSLKAFGITDALDDTYLKLYNDKGVVLFENDNWDYATINSVANSLGAYGYTMGSKDAALLVTLDPGVYTAEVSSVNAKQIGTAIVEVYEVDIANKDSHLSNISTRSRVVLSYASSMTAGFVISGTDSKKLLIRGIGPGLTQFGVSNVVSDVVLSVRDSNGQQIGYNEGWESDNKAGIADAARAVGAFALPDGSKDSALLMTLAPGSYTVVVTRYAYGSNVDGTGLVEVYEVE